MSLLAHATIVALLFSAIWGLVASRSVIGAVACLNIAKSATAVHLVAIGYRAPAAAPIVEGGEPATATVDPVVQALVLVDVVIGAAITALILALAVEFVRRRGSVDPRDLVPRRK